MADAALSSAKAKLQEIARLQPVAPTGPIAGLVKAPRQDAVQAEQCRSQASEALYLAQEALVAYRRAGEAEKKVAALRAVVDAHLALGQSFEALMAASDELAMIKRTMDKKAQVQVSQIVSEVQTARSDFGSALQTVNESLELFRELGDKAGEAKALVTQASAKLQVGRGKEAMAASQQALGIFHEIGDKDGEASATRVINQCHAHLGQIDKAPNRGEALQALQVLASSIENRDKRAWDKAIQELNKTTAYSQKDVQNTVGVALQKDRAAAASFLREQGIDTPGSTPQMIIREVVKQLTYLSFRTHGGLQYGPRFRCLQAYAMEIQSTDTLQALGCLQISEEADDWERELAFHPGILDATLQSGSAFGAFY